LLAYALFDVDERVRELQDQLRIFLASVALFDSPSALSPPEVRDAIARDLHVGGELTTSDVEKALRVGARVRLFERFKDDRYTLTTARREQLSEASARYDDHRRAFYEHIARSVEGETGLVLEDEVRSQFEQELDSSLQALFHEQSVALSESFSGDETRLDSELEHLSRSKRLTNVLDTIGPANERLRRAQAQEGIRQALLELSSDERAYLAALYHKAVAFALLHQDPTIQKLKSDLGRQRVAYLDTNVIMAWAFEEHPLHRIARDAVDISLAVGCKLLASQFTIDEFQLQLEEAETTYRKIASMGNLLATVDDDIIRTFGKRRILQPGLEWAGFIADYGSVSEYLTEKGILPDGTDCERPRLDDRWERAVSTLQAVKRTKSLPREVHEFDASNLVLVQLRRRALRSDAMGFRVWLVTLDGGVREADKRLLRNQTFIAPGTRHAKVWSAYLSPCLPPENDDLGEYVETLLASRLGLVVEDPVFVDTNFLETLQNAPFNVSDLLESSPERARRVLVALQEDKEVRKLLDRAPDRSDGGDRVNEWSREVAIALAKFSDAVDSEGLRERAMTAHDAREFAERELERLRAERDALQIELDRANSKPDVQRSWIARIIERVFRSSGD
jgi:hypothetical protein